MNSGGLNGGRQSSGSGGDAAGGVGTGGGGGGGGAGHRLTQLVSGLSRGDIFGITIGQGGAGGAKGTGTDSHTDGARGGNGLVTLYPIY